MLFIIEYDMTEALIVKDETLTPQFLIFFNISPSSVKFC